MLFGIRRDRRRIETNRRKMDCSLIEYIRVNITKKTLVCKIIANSGTFNMRSVLAVETISQNNCSDSSSVIDSNSVM